MKAPFQIVPINEAVVRVIDAQGENVAVMPMRPAARLLELVNTIPALTVALKALTVAAWNSGNEAMLDFACAGEETVRLVEPAFALCVWTAPDPSITDCESLWVVGALESDCAPAARVAGEENPSGS